MKHIHLFLGLALIPLFPFFTNLHIAHGINGAVKSAAGQPLQAVTVSAFAQGKMIQSAQTDAAGAYRLTLAEGKYDVEFTLPDYETLTVLEVVVGPSHTGPLDITLDSALLSKQRLTRVWQPYQNQRHELEEDAVLDMLVDKPADGRKVVAPTRVATEELTYSPDRVAADETSGGRSIDETVHVLEPKSKRKEIAALGSAKPAPAPTARDKRSEAAPTAVLKEAAKTEVPAGALGSSILDARPSTDDADLNPFRGNKFDLKLAPKFDSKPAPKAGLLTAGEWNDLDNWATHWTDLLSDGEIAEWQNLYGCFPRYRFTALLQNKAGFPAIDIPLQLKDEQGTVLWEARTDNTGKAELWYAFFDNNKTTTPRLQISAVLDGKVTVLGPAQPFAQGINRFQVDIDCQAPPLLDIVWAVDATGSMGDEIQYLKTELLDVIGRVKNVQRQLTIRMGSVFYRDVTDDYIVKSSGLSPDIRRTVAYIGEQSAGGGGDYPEAVHTALEEAIFRQQWSEKAVARICFLVLDASPHQSPEINASLQRSIQEAARRGIRIVPVSASGIQKDTEFLMKFLGLATNGSYVFLTDHSGIGEKHIEATTDEYKVEPLNQLLVRLITQYATIADCEGKLAVRFETPTDSLAQAAALQPVTYFPNPAVRQLNIELPFDADKVTLYNAQGVAAFTLNGTAAGRHSIPVEQLPAGFYTLRIWKAGQVQSGKVMVIRT